MEIYGDPVVNVSAVVTGVRRGDQGDGWWTLPNGCDGREADRLIQPDGNEHWLSRIHARSRSPSSQPLPRQSL